MKTIDYTYNTKIPSALKTALSLLGAGLFLSAFGTSPALARTNYTFAETPSFSDDFNSNWKASDNGWRIATWKQNDTQMSPERCRVDGNGNMVQTVLKGIPKCGGSMQSNREFPHGRWVARLKPSAVPGALNSMFTMDWDDLTTAVDHDGAKGEVDMEFLTYTFGKDRGYVHLAIHMKDRHDYFVKDAPLRFNPSDDFHEWGFDILPDRVRWYVDGKMIEECVLKSKDTLEPNYEFFINSWTRGTWINGPPQEDAHYEIDWVKFFPLVDEATTEE